MITVHLCVVSVWCIVLRCGTVPQAETAFVSAWLLFVVLNTRGSKCVGCYPAFVEHETEWLAVRHLQDGMFYLIVHRGLGEGAGMFAYLDESQEALLLPPAWPYAGHIGGHRSWGVYLAFP